MLSSWESRNCRAEKAAHKYRELSPGHAGTVTPKLTSPEFTVNRKQKFSLGAPRPGSSSVLAPFSR